MTETPTQLYPMLAVNEIVPEDQLAGFEKTHLAQIKWDGTRVITIKHGDRVHLMTRKWKNDLAERFPGIVSDLRQIQGDMLLDGELVFFRKDTGLPQFRTALSTEESKKDYDVRLILFDIMEYQNFTNLKHEPQETRTEFLGALGKKFSWEHLRVIETVETGFAPLFRSVVDAGGEGIMLKEKSAPYHFGKDEKDRVKTWRKAKRFSSHDCFVLGMQPGNGKYKDTLGALILGQLINGKVCKVGKCSGMTDAQRASFYRDITAAGETEHPTMVVEVKCMERNPETGVMRHPIFLRVRDDKDWTQCVWEGE
jgi:ATP-dependent DNA ligase